MPSPVKLSRREREIMNLLFANQRMSVLEICQKLQESPTPMAVRRMLAILQEKGHIKREKVGREFIYLPKQSRVKAGLNALKQVLETFFEGSMTTALATHLEKPNAKLSDEDVLKLKELIDQHARSQDKKGE
jgi:BlaI family penicillinase repressor